MHVYGRTLVGSRFPRDVFDSNNLEIRFVRERAGDTRGMYRTDVLRRYPFPEEFLQAYVPESLVWDRIAQNYRSRFVNEVVGYTEYQVDGLSNLPSTARFADPGPWVLVYAQRLVMKRRLPATEVLRSGANYMRFSLHGSVPLWTNFSAPPPGRCTCSPPRQGSRCTYEIGGTCGIGVGCHGAAEPGDREFCLAGH